MEKSKQSYLELIIGPMFSGKTTQLLEVYKKCKFCNIQALVINHSFDKRYHETMLSNHDKIMIPCVQTMELASVWDPLKFSDIDVILINEGQFFSDLFDIVLDMMKYNKKIYIAGLDGDFERKKFGQMLDLIPLCDKVTKLASLCSKCKDGTYGIFSMRLTSEKMQTVIGSDNYIPVCRKCYEENT
jgi:thymidine kinase